MELERAGLDGNNGKSAERTAAKSTNRSRNDSDLPLRLPHNPEAVGSSPASATRKVLKSQDFRTFFALFLPDNLLAVFSDPNADPNGTGSGKHQTARERILPIVFAASRLAEVVT